MKKIIESFRWIFLLLFDLLALFVITREKDNSLKKVLVVKLDAIGDFILWLDAAEALRRRYPPDQYEVTLLGNRAWESLAATLPYFDDVWSIDRNKFLTNLPYRLGMLRRIRRAGFNILINPTFSRELLFGDAIVRLCNARERIGYEGDISNIKPWKKGFSDGWYTRLIPTPGWQLMELERNAEFIRGLGLADFRAGLPKMPFARILPPGFTLDTYYILFPGAGSPVRQWPLERFSALAELIHRATGWTGLICGGAGEEDLGRILVEATGVPLQNWVGRTSLTELIAVVEKAQLLVSNETSAVHIAAAVATPSVCICGGGHYGRFLPYRLEAEINSPLPVVLTAPMECFGCNWRCCYATNCNEAATCIASISLDEVWAATEKILVALGKG